MIDSILVLYKKMYGRFTLKEQEECVIIRFYFSYERACKRKVYTFGIVIYLMECGDTVGS